MIRALAARLRFFVQLYSTLTNIQLRAADTNHQGKTLVVHINLFLSFRLGEERTLWRCL